MQNDHFEWDDAKAADNVVKHNLTFAEARPVFDDPGAVTYPDDDPDEDREITIGYAGDLLLFVVSTERDGRTRIISARRATRAEKRRYENG